MINIIIITHGDFGAYLIEAAETIVGRQDEGLKNISISPRFSFDDLNKIIEKAFQEMQSEEGLIIFNDMPGGTPMNLSLPFAQKIEKSAVICGVNISMLISAFVYRKNLPFEALIEKVLNDGKRAICEVKGILNKTEINK